MESSVPAPPASAWHTPSTEKAAPRSSGGVRSVSAALSGGCTAEQPSST